MPRLILAITLLSMSCAAIAASHDLSTFIGEYDLDRNGSASKEEFALERERRFAATDQNHDSGLSREEYVAEFQIRLKAGNLDDEQQKRQMRQADIRFAVLDSNQNGAISMAEFTYSGWMMFASHDVDKNGAISVDDQKPAKQAGASPSAPQT